MDTRSLIEFGLNRFLITTEEAVELAELSFTEVLTHILVSAGFIPSVIDLFLSEASGGHLDLDTIVTWQNEPLCLRAAAR
jgi:hypothetical protein